MAIAPETIQPDPMLPEPFRVERVRKESPDTFTLALKPAGAARTIPFAPGQFNMLYVFGTGESAISLSGRPDRTDSYIHTVRAVGAVTRAIGRLKPGDVLGVRGPFGSSWPVEDAAGHDLLFIAGGIGLAPLRPAVYQALAPKRRDRRVVVLYGARTARDLLYAGEIARWRDRSGIDVEVTLDTATPEWDGHVGVVSTLIPKAKIRPESCVAMICGPEVMMRFTVLELQKLGVPPDRIFVSMERNMKCAVGFCGHCQYGPHFICKDGPVFRSDRLAALFFKREI